MKHMTKRALALLLVLVTVLTVFPVMTSTAVAAEETSALDDTATSYDAWYVQDGLVMLLSAFDQTKAGITVADGLFASWNNKVKGGADAAFYQTAAVTWKFREGMGVGYDLTAAQVANTILGKSLRLDLGKSIVNAYADFTVEYFANVMRASENGAYVSGSSHNTNVNNEKLGPWGTWQYSMESSGDQSRCHYTANVLGDYGHDNAINNFEPGGYILNLWNKVMVGGVATQDIPKGISSVILNPSATQSSRTYYANGELVKTFNRKSGALISGANDFFLMGGAGNTTYSVRVYNRALNDAERWQNHFVDMAAYLGADISPLAAMTPEARRSLFSAARGWKVGVTTKESVENVIASLSKGFSFDKYDELYVQDGLTFLATAFDKNTSSADVNNGMWFNKKGVGFASLQGGVYAEGTNETGWKQGKGISWEQNVAKSGTGNKSTGLYLDYSHFGTNFTVQLVNAWEGLTNNGSPYDTPYYYQVYHFETAEPAGWRTTEQPAEGTNYVTVTEGDVTYYYPGTAYTVKENGVNVTKYWYWGTVTQKDKNGVDTVTWHKATELNADGTVKSYYGVSTEGNRYGNTINDSVAFGNIRNMMWLNHTTIYYRSKGWLDGTERKVQEGSDFYANRWYYRSVGYIAHAATADQANYDYLSDDRSLLRTYGAEDPFVLTLTQEAKETATGVGIYFDNKTFWQEDTPTSLVATHVPTSGGMYQVKGIAGDYYAVRVYTKVLSETEKLQNYFVDVCAYNGLDVTGVKELMASNPDAAQAMFRAMADFSIRDPRVGAMQAVIDAAIEGIVPTAAKMNAYDKLYVQEGLKALFTAFNAEGSGLDLAAGTWTDKKSGTSITLVDNSSNTNWELGANNQGVGYAFRDMAQLNSDKLNVGMRLPTNALSDESMAVEYTFAITPVLKADGTQEKVIRIDTGMKSQNKDTGKYTDVVYRYTAGGQWGLYNGSTASNFSFGGLQMCFFHLSGNPQGNSMCMRMFYSGKPFENTSGGNDRSWIEGHGFFGSSSYNTDVQTLTVNRGVTARDGVGAYNRVDIDVLLNRVSKAKINNDEGSSEQKMFYTLESIKNDTYTASNAADAFFGMPSTVYAIRIYSDTLTDAQMKQNHAVDLMAYFGLDVRGFAAAAEAKKTAVYEAFAAYTFNDADKTGEMQEAIDAAVAGIPVAEGVQVANDGTALRIWASMDTAENVSKLGMTVVFKKDGVVVSEKSGETNTAFESITSAGKTVTAEELRAELLYAAVVKGIPAGTYTVEVTPYVVMMDETTVTGETKTMDLTFGG